MRLLGHDPCRLRPARARTSRRLDDKASRLGEQFDLVGQLRLIQENLWDADASRVAYPDDAGLDCHVLTV